jgi:hypothetical protein
MTNQGAAAEAAECDGAISVKEFCRRNGIGVTTFYAEVADGRLIARKCRSRTLVAMADEKAWRDNLPKVELASAAALDRARADGLLPIEAQQ